jgi:hypothetical protein
VGKSAFQCHRVYVNQQRGFRFFWDYYDGKQMHSGTAKTQAEAELAAAKFGYRIERRLTNWITPLRRSTASHSSR